MSIKTPGRHADGGNLSLTITAGGGRSRMLMDVFAGRQRERSSARDVTLAEARDLAAQHRRTLRAGIDPLEARRVAVAKPTVAAFAETHIASMEAGWRHETHRAQRRSTLKIEAAPLARLAVTRLPIDPAQEPGRAPSQTPSDRDIGEAAECRDGAIPAPSAAIPASRGTARNLLIRSCATSARSG